MTKTLVDLDEKLLARAQQLLGAKTKKETIARALELVVADAERWEAVNREIARGESGYYSRLLTDPDIPWNR
jgi:Arc/MetJ family transcription regulator